MKRTEADQKRRRALYMARTARERRLGEKRCRRLQVASERREERYAQDLALERLRLSATRLTCGHLYCSCPMPTHTDHADYKTAGFEGVQRLISKNRREATRLWRQSVPQK